MTKEEAAETLSKAGMAHADVIATVTHLDEADALGITGQGMVRVPWLAEMKWEPSDPAYADKIWTHRQPHTNVWRVSSRQRIGYAVMEAAVQLPLDKSNANLIVVERCFPSGALSVWARKLAHKGFCSVITALSPLRASHPDSETASTGTTPLCVCVPDPHDQHLVADLALTERTYGDVLAGNASEDEIVFRDVRMWALAIALETLARSMAGTPNTVLILAWRPINQNVVAHTRRLAGDHRLPGGLV
jgi:LDH2 family malate/lactate/ureidoglycolate dehydrogenase